MAKLRIDVGLSERGTSLRTYGRRLRDMDDRQVTGLFRKALEDAAPPFVAAVRASALAIPTTGEKHTGLRARIAVCAEQATWGQGRTVNVAVEINPARMPPGEMGLPLYMEGAAGGGRGQRGHARWRHPVYGNRENWVTQASHPYFYQAAGGFGRAGAEAVKAAVEDIGRKLNE